MLAAAVRKLFPICAFIFFGSIAVALWQAQCRQEHELILRHVENAVEQARIRIEGVINTRTASLELMADRWVDKTPPDFSQQRFLSFSKIIFEHYPGLAGIYWIDPQGLIQWVFPEETNAEIKGRRAYDRPDLQKAVLEAARQRTEPTVTPCVDLYKGGNGFEVILPLIYNAELQGYLSGAFQVAQIVDIALPKSITDDFGVAIYECDQPIFRSGTQSYAGSEGNGIRGMRKIEVGNRTWHLYMEPSRTLYSPDSFRNFLFLAFGIVLSATLSLLLYLLLRRMEAYRISRDLALHEVNERKRAEAALRENEKKLEKLLAELSGKNAELESFVYTISHDLKTPIVTIEGFIGALREDFGAVLPDAAEKYLKYMSDAARKLEVLINDLLDLSRIGRMAGNRVPVPFGDLVKDALEILQPQIDARGISIGVQPNLPDVYGERKRLGQVIYNLLNNAVKYAGRNNPAPRIDVGAEKQDGHDVFFVRDNGIGIEEKYFSKIFQIFERLPAAKLEEGTGIGLTIVKRIIEYHGGRIWLTSEPHEGTTFFFTIEDKEA